MRRRPLLYITLCALFLILCINAIFYFLVDTGLSTSQDVSSNNIKITSAATLLLEKNKNVAKVQSNRQGPSNKQRKFYPVKGPEQLVAIINAEKKIKATLSHLDSSFNTTSPSYLTILSSILRDLKSTQPVSNNLWVTANKHNNQDAYSFMSLLVTEEELRYKDSIENLMHNLKNCKHWLKWVNGREIVPEKAPLLGSILNTLCSSKIIKADNSKKGTQLKLALTLEGGEKALFKPQWYKREDVISGSVYAGKDRHNAEVAAFHLSLLLGLRRVPLTVGRKVDLRREVMPVASPSLRETFYQEGNNTCFFGICLYCSAADPVCANRNIIEGALILWLPSHLNFARYAHPWQRSYRNNLVARWEIEEDYCEKVKKARPYSQDSNERLLDLIDGSVFDFLIDNGDRHHYEAPSNVENASVFLFDNGKSFGDPSKDHLDILAPLYQCCILRKKTWESLLAFRGGALSSSLEQTLQFSHIAPVLAQEHLLALDRRLLLIFGAVEVCFGEKGRLQVLL